MITDSPIVNKDWLLDCYKQARRLSLKNYLVGDSILPMDDIEEYDEIFNSQPLANEIQLHKRDNSENKPIESKCFSHSINFDASLLDIVAFT